MCQWGRHRAHRTPPAAQSSVNAHVGGIGVTTVGEAVSDCTATGRHEVCPEPCEGHGRPSDLSLRRWAGAVRDSCRTCEPSLAMVRRLTSQNLAPIWFPHCPPWMCTISRILQVDWLAGLTQLCLAGCWAHSNCSCCVVAFLHCPGSREWDYCDSLAPRGRWVDKRFKCNGIDWASLGFAERAINSEIVFRPKM